MTGRQFDLMSGGLGFSIIGAGLGTGGSIFWVVLTGITDGANVTLTTKDDSFTLSKLGTHIPDGYPLYNKFTSISIDAALTEGAAVCYWSKLDFSN